MTESQGSAFGRLLERLPFQGGNPLLKGAAVFAGVFLAFLARQSLQGPLPFLSPFTTFFSLMVIIAFVLGVRWGSVAFLLSLLLGWYYFLEPQNSFALTLQSRVVLFTFTFNSSVVLLAIAWLQRTKVSLLLEREASAHLAQTRELLFKELQHRVSNNLQIAAALLSVQRRSITDPQGQAALDEASRRLGVIGRISRQLYDPEGGSQPLRPFLEQLASDVIESNGRLGILHRVDGADDVQLTPEASIPLALVVAEAISNAIEHGFDEEQQDCRLTIRLHPHGAQHLAVEVEDNGCGLPQGFALEGSESLGLKIANMLAGQLGGRFMLQPAPSGGTLARVELPLTA